MLEMQQHYTLYSVPAICLHTSHFTTAGDAARCTAYRALQELQRVMVLKQEHVWKRCTQSET
jgi:hypothetical protein